MSRQIPPFFKAPPTYTPIGETAGLLPEDWTKWFLELTNVLSNSGAGSGKITSAPLIASEVISTLPHYLMMQAAQGTDSPAYATIKTSAPTFTPSTGVLAVPKVGVNVTSPGARLHVLDATGTDQFRYGWDGSNYFRTNVGSAGDTTIQAVGSSGEIQVVSTSGSTSWGTAIRGQGESGVWTGVGTVSSSGTTVTGTGSTAFQTKLAVGDRIATAQDAYATYYTITNIASQTSLTTAVAISPAASGHAWRAHRATLSAQPSPWSGSPPFLVNDLGSSGFGTAVPRAKVHIENGSNEVLCLGYDSSHHVSFKLDSGGQLFIDHLGTATTSNQIIFAHDTLQPATQYGAVIVYNGGQGGHLAAFYVNGLGSNAVSTTNQNQVVMQNENGIHSFSAIGTPVEADVGYGLGQLVAKSALTDTVVDMSVPWSATGQVIPAYLLGAFRTWNPSGVALTLPLGAIVGRVTYKGTGGSSGGGHIVGVVGAAEMNDTGQTLQDAYGLEGRFDCAAGTVTRARAMAAIGGVNNGTVTSFSGLDIQDMSGTAPVTTYGVYSNIPNRTTAYNFYAAGTAPNYMAGALTVAGHVTLEGVTSTGASGTGNLIFDTTPTFNGQVTFNAAAPTGTQRVQWTTGVTTGSPYWQIDNTSGMMFLGVEGSTGNTLLINSTAYSTILSTGNTNQDLFLGTNQTGRVKIAAAGGVTFFNSITIPGGTLLTTSTALTNGAGALIGTLTNSPVTGNPTKWIPINDNGTTRYIPAW